MTRAHNIGVRIRTAVGVTRTHLLEYRCSGQMWATATREILSPSIDMRREYCHETDLSGARNIVGGHVASSTSSKHKMTDRDCYECTMAPWICLCLRSICFLGFAECIARSLPGVGLNSWGRSPGSRFCDKRREKAANCGKSEQ